MSQPVHLRPADARLVPWKNGRGMTRELALGPSGASFERGDFDWRISAASVEEDGPFSSFPGIERVLVVTAGAGIVLDHGASAPRARVERLVPYRFSGDWPTRGELVAGRVEDFNVLCRRGAVRAEVEVLAGQVERVASARAGEQHLLHVLEGSLLVRSSPRDRSWTLASAESLWFAEENASELTLAGRCTALLVRLSRVSAG